MHLFCLRGPLVPVFLVILFLVSVSSGAAPERIEGRYGYPTAPGAFRAGYVRSETGHTTLWVVEHLTADRFGATLPRDEFSFRADSDVPREFRAREGDYRNSGYDKGHLARFANNEFSRQAAADSMLLSNVVPQNPALNEDEKLGWAALETDLAARVVNGPCEAWLFTGPAFLPDPKGVVSHATLGPNGRVSVPTHLWKAVLFVDSTQDKPSLSMQAWLIPNIAPTQPYAAYAVSVDALERAVGLDFFAALDDGVEAKLEGKKP